MKLISSYLARFAVGSEEHKFKAIFTTLFFLVLGFTAIAIFSIAIKGLNFGYPFAPSMGLLIISLVFTLLAMYVPRIVNQWLR